MSTIHEHIQKVLNHFAGVSLNDLIRSAHTEASKKKKQGHDYRRAFMDALWPQVQDLYHITISQREMDRFERSLWATIDLWKETQGKKSTGKVQSVKTVGEMLEMVSRVTHKYMTEKKSNGGIKR